MEWAGSVWRGRISDSAPPVSPIAASDVSGVSQVRDRPSMGCHDDRGGRQPPGSQIAEAALGPPSRLAHRPRVHGFLDSPGSGGQ
eukprot:5701166-Pyramimonas_sp.AAC.1